MGLLVPLKPYQVSPPRKDPKGNRIAQWLDRAVVGSILDLKHPMIPEAEQGRYTIGATTDKGERIQQDFELREYGGFRIRLPASDRCSTRFLLVQCCPSMK